jgi:quercetin dioxygenase-like cupin family protein
VSGWAVVRLESVETSSLPDGRVRRAIRKHLDVRSFGVNAYTGEAGQVVIEEHDEAEALNSGHEELYVVLEGHATFTVGGEDVDAPAGTLVFVGDAGTRRGAVAGESRTTVLVVGAPAGEAYEVGAWEDMAGFFDFYLAGDYEGAAAHLEECLRLHPGYPGALFNLACSESLAGRTDDALEHLRAALAAEPKLRDNARTDDDLAPIRDDPRFDEVLA